MEGYVMHEDTTTQPTSDTLRKKAIWEIRKNQWIMKFFILFLAIVLYAGCLSISYGSYQTIQYFYAVHGSLATTNIIHDIIILASFLAFAFSFAMIALLTFYIKEAIVCSKHFLAKTILIKHIVPFKMYKAYQKNFKDIDEHYKNRLRREKSIAYCPVLSMLYFYQGSWGQDVLSKIYEKNIPPWRVFLTKLLLSTPKELSRFLFIDLNSENTQCFISAVESYFKLTHALFKEFVYYLNSTYYSKSNRMYDVAKSRIPIVSSHAFGRFVLVMPEIKFQNNYPFDPKLSLPFADIERQYIFNSWVFIHNTNENTIIPFVFDYRWFGEKFRALLDVYVYYGLCKQKLLKYEHEYSQYFWSKIDYFNLIAPQFTLFIKNIGSNVLFLVSFGDNALAYHTAILKKIYLLLKSHRELEFVYRKKRPCEN